MSMRGRRARDAEASIIDCYPAGDGCCALVCQRRRGQQVTMPYVRRDLVVNRYAADDPTSPPQAPLIDPLLVNPWGAAIRTAGLGGHFWLANAGSATVTTYVGDVYDESGQFIPLFQDELKFVAVEGSAIGQVFSASPSDFPVTGPLCTNDKSRHLRCHAGIGIPGRIHRPEPLYRRHGGGPNRGLDRGHLQRSVRPPAGLRHGPRPRGPGCAVSWPGCHRI